MSQNMQKALKMRKKLAYYFWGVSDWLWSRSPLSMYVTLKESFYESLKYILLTEAIIWHDNFGAVL